MNTSAVLPLAAISDKVGAALEEIRLDGPPADVRVLCIRLDMAGGIASTALQALDPDEIERMSRYRREEDRLRFGVTRAALKHVLAVLTDRRSPADVSLRPDARGRPALSDACDESAFCATAGGVSSSNVHADGSQDAALDFNVSHSGGLACIALSDRRRVGVDIERTDAAAIGPDVEAIALTPAECAALRILPDAQRQDAFFGCWVCKEALLKAAGLGITRALQDFSVYPPSEYAGRARVEPSALPNHAAMLDALRVQTFDVASGYAAALAWSRV